MRDFTLQKYKKLLQSMIDSGYTFQTVSEFNDTPSSRVILLRHDIDDKKQQALIFARIQAELNIKGTYYFRIVKNVFDPSIISEIDKMGHEIGYHYEDMDLAKGDVDKAYDFSVKHLEMFREFVDVKTICMHGSPLSKFDNKDVWRKYDYKKLGILTEPYFDIDFNNVLYLTDTGRKWNSSAASVRDKVKSGYSHNFSSTEQIISALKTNSLPNKIMMNFHPQRWMDNPTSWTTELLTQNLKNVVKAAITTFRK